MTTNKVLLKTRYCLQCGDVLEITGKYCRLCCNTRAKPSAHNFRAAKLGIAGTFTVDEWLSLQQEYDGVCLRCGLSKMLTPDHVLPLSIEGSTNYISNIQPLCLDCNLFKNDEFIDYRDEDIKARHARWERIRKGRVLDALSLQERTVAWTTHGGRQVTVLVFPDRYEVSVDNTLKMTAYEIEPLSDEFILDHSHIGVVSKVARVALTKDQASILESLKNKLCIL